MNTSTGYLNADGTPNLSALIETFNRCGPTMSGGVEWLNNIRFNRWPGQAPDGRKHDGSGPADKALPWDNASDCRPGVVDDVINELKAMMTAAFWRAMVNPGSAESAESGYAVALVEWLVFNKLMGALVDEVELSADYVQHLGWCLLAPRWKRELGLKPYTLRLEQIQAAADQETQAAQAQQRPPGPFANLPMLILDPTQEDAAVEFLQQWYDYYVASQVPEDLRARVPKTTEAKARRAVRALRTERKARVPLPYLCVNEPEIIALKPWEEVFLPPELTSEHEIVFQVEQLSPSALRARELAMGYDPEWIEAAVKQRTSWAPTVLPTGTPQGLTNLNSGTPSPASPGGIGTPDQGSVEVVYAIYRENDADGIPAVYCTTFHRNLSKRANSSADLYALHELVDAALPNSLPYVACLRERWSRSLAASRGVTEMAHTDQNLIKGHLDSTLDLTSLSVLPPMNVYTSPTGDEREYEFAPGKRNYTRKDREPQLMEMSNRGGMINGMEAVMQLQQRIDNRFGALSVEVPPVRQQLKQEAGVRRFNAAWTQAFKHVLAFYQKHGDDAEFARVTGADPGWLEQRREVPGLLTCVLDFDPRELDPELELKRVETMNKIVLPNDVLGVIPRGEWAAEMARSVLGPRRAKRLVRSVPEASQYLRDKVKTEVAQMFLGNSPNYLDDKDPTAASLLQFTQEIVMQNPVYLSSLDDEALVAVAGQQAQTIAQQLPRNPNPRFSQLLLKWLENLKFIGVTQQQNKQIGRIGVDPNTTG